MKEKDLEENDVLELGWKKHSRWESYHFDIFTLCFDSNKRENVTIFIDAVEATHPNYLFKGCCKNKSVLKQLMEMLNII
jgi:hypothetical protein